MNEPIEVKYYVDRAVESKIKIDVLQPFVNHGLLKFIGLHKKFNRNNVKELYCNVKVTRGGLRCQFCGQIIEFHQDFKTHFGLEFKRMDVCVSNASCLNRVGLNIFKQVPS